MGSCSGACCFTDQNIAHKFLRQTIWEKLKVCVKWFLYHSVQIIVVNRKMVLEKRGFMFYCTISQKYTPIFGGMEN